MHPRPVVMQSGKSNAVLCEQCSNRDTRNVIKFSNSELLLSLGRTLAWSGNSTGQDSYQSSNRDSVSLNSFSSHMSFKSHVQYLNTSCQRGLDILRVARHWPGSRSYIIIIIINPLTARVVGSPQMILQPVFSIFPCSPPPSGTCRTPGLSIP